MAAYWQTRNLKFAGVTCRLTACTPGSAPGPTLGIEYGKPLPFTFYPVVVMFFWSCSFDFCPDALVSSFQIGAIEH